jgi:hypothetical protein
LLKPYSSERTINTKAAEAAAATQQQQPSTAAGATALHRMPIRLHAIGRLVLEEAYSNASSSNSSNVQKQQQQ